MDKAIVLFLVIILTGFWSYQLFVTTKQLLEETKNNVETQMARTFNPPE
jgi:hypothetical protein